MGAPSVDSSDFPIVRLLFEQELTVEDVLAHDAKFKALYAQRGPFLTIANIDAADLSKHTPAARKAMAESADYFAERNGFIAEYIVVSSSLRRGLFTAYSWLRRSKTHPVKIFATMDAAMKEARATLANRSVLRT